MTNKLGVVINSLLKVPKIKKILLYEMKFLVPNYSCLRNSWLGGYRPQIAVLSVLCPQPNLLNPPPKQNSWVRHCIHTNQKKNLLLGYSQFQYNRLEGHATDQVVIHRSLALNFRIQPKPSSCRICDGRERGLHRVFLLSSVTITPPMFSTKNI